jgi:hypothetical protein
MTKQSFLHEAIEMWRDLEEFKRSGSKEAFKKQLGEEFVRRLGAASLDEALATAMMSLAPLLRQTRGQSRKRGAPELNEDSASHRSRASSL